MSSGSQFMRMFSHVSRDRREDEPAQAPEPPRWPAHGPPGEELGAAVPLLAVVGRSQSGAVGLPQVTVYSEGMTPHFVALARGLGRRQSNRLLHDQHRFDEDDEPGDGFLRVGLELPDGRRVSNLGLRGTGHYASVQEPAQLAFFEHDGGGGSGAGGRLSLRPAFWLWPLPDAGAIQVFCEWPVVGIPLSSVLVDVDPLLEARERVVRLWPSSA